MPRNNEALAWVPVITPRHVDEARKTLGLGDTATFEEMRAAYRHLAKDWHPDRAPMAEKEDYNRVFQKLSAAYAYLKVLVRNYRYDLSEDTIKRDQEPVDIRHLRRFGGGLYGEEEPDLQDDPRRGPLRLTAENVTLAHNKLGLLTLTSGEQITHNFRKRVTQLSHHGEETAETNLELTEINRCHELLQHLMAVYRYSFRPEDIASKQQDLLESHRERHGNAPVWAGGTYDDSENSSGTRSNTP